MPIYRSVGRSGPPFLGKATKSTSYRIRTTFVLSSCTHHAGESQTCASDDVRRLGPWRGRASPSRKPFSGFSGGISRQLFFQGLLHPFLPVAVSLGCQQQYRRGAAVGLRRQVAPSARDEKGRKIASCGLATMVGIHCTTTYFPQSPRFQLGGSAVVTFRFCSTHRAPIVSLPPDCPFLSGRTYSTDVLHRRAKNG